MIDQSPGVRPAKPAGTFKRANLTVACSSEALGRSIPLGRASGGRETRSLALFFILSGGLHLLAFSLAKVGGEAEPPRPLMVSLLAPPPRPEPPPVAPPEPPPEVRPEPEAQPPKPPKRKMARRPKRPQARPVVEAPSLPEAPAGDIPSPAPAEPQRASLVAAAPAVVARPEPMMASGHELEAYRRQIRERVEGAKRYPLMARRRRQEGRATVRFVLARSGRLGEVALAKSSGQALLDQAALKAIQDGAPYPPFPASLGRQEMVFRLPLRFELR